MSSVIKVKQGEARSIFLFCSDAFGAPVDLSAAILFLGVKRDPQDADYVFSHGDVDFDKTQAAQGIVGIGLTTLDTAHDTGLYVAELKCNWNGTNIQKTPTFNIEILQAVTT